MEPGLLGAALAGWVVSTSRETTSWWQAMNS